MWNNRNNISTTLRCASVIIGQTWIEIAQSKSTQDKFLLYSSGGIVNKIKFKYNYTVINDCWDTQYYYFLYCPYVN